MEIRDIDNVEDNLNNFTFELFVIKITYKFFQAFSV